MEVLLFAIPKVVGTPRILRDSVPPQAGNPTPATLQKARKGLFSLRGAGPATCHKRDKPRYLPYAGPAPIPGYRYIPLWRTPGRSHQYHVTPGKCLNFPMAYTVYVVESEEGHTYAGMTNDLERRLREHKSGQSRYTRRGKGWEVIYREEVSTREEARKREQ